MTIAFLTLRPLKAFKPTPLHFFFYGNGRSQRQFLIETTVSSRRGYDCFPKILVDTGAQPNLVKRGLFPRFLFRQASRQLNLSAANQTRIEGGTHTILLTLTFLNSFTGKIHRLHGSFYEADISVDLILSNSWLAQNDIVLLPSENRLAIKQGDVHCFLEPWNANSPDDEHIQTTPIRFMETRTNSLYKKKNSHVRFCCPGSVGETDIDLDDAELDNISAMFSEPSGRPFKVFGLVQSERPSEHPLAQILRDKLYEDYKTTVFRGEIYHNPQPRGPSGMATITLKPGATPKYTRPIPCQGEKLEALKRILEKWKSQKKLEPAKPSGWGSPMFLVPKPHKPQDPWRAVIDVRGPNEAAEPDNYTIPLIEEVLIQQGKKKCGRFLT